MRQLESENERLTVSIRDTEVVQKKEKNSLENRYEVELVSDGKRRREKEWLSLFRVVSVMHSTCALEKSRSCKWKEIR